MKKVLSTTIAALFAVGLSGAALAEKPVQDQSVTPASDTTTATDTQTDPINHGQTVREAAQNQDQLPADTTVSDVAHLNRDFKKFDADKSGSLSLAELNSDAELSANFSTLDENGDGMLSDAEFNGHLQLGQSDDDVVEDEE